MGEYCPSHLPGSVLFLIRAECGDYDRRRRALQRLDLSPDVAASLAARNAAIEKALSVVEAPLRAPILEDIKRGYGYERSAAATIASKGLYYSRKHKILEAMAVNLGLM